MRRLYEYRQRRFGARAGKVEDAQAADDLWLQSCGHIPKNWDAARIESEMKQAAEWARRRGVPLVCNEFGVYRNVADPQDRGPAHHQRQCLQEAVYDRRPRRRLGRRNGLAAANHVANA